MVEKGHIYRGKKPVHWSPSSRTALAEAELEYPENHVSKSVYVAFTVTQPSPALAALAATTGSQNQQLRVAIWTTTPWTLPANLAVAVNSDLDYALVSLYPHPPTLIPHYCHRIVILTLTSLLFPFLNLHLSPPRPNHLNH